MGNRRVRTLWCDLNGLSHGRYIPEHRIDEPTHHAITTLVMGIDGAIQPVEGYSGDVGYPDMNATAIPATRRSGWEVDTDVAVASLTFGESPVAICPRNASSAPRRVAGDRLRKDLGYGSSLSVHARHDRRGAGGRSSAPGLRQRRSATHPQGDTYYD